VFAFLVVLIAASTVAIAQPVAPPPERINAVGNPWNCRDEFVDWMGAGGGYFVTVCDDTPTFSDPTANDVPVGGGAPPAVSQQERDRLDRCARAQSDWDRKGCAGTRPSRASNDFDINFNFPTGMNYDLMRPIALAFHQALWDDFFDNTWANYTQYRTSMRQMCDTDATFLGNLTAPACRLLVDQYFGQFFEPGFQGWTSSRAATDAQSSRNGQVCRNIAVVRAADGCI